MSPEQKSRKVHPAQAGIRSTLIGMGVNFFMALIKGTTGILGNSYALVADAIESASDVLASIIVWIGLRTAAKAPDKEHPYGHGKAEPLAAIVVAIFIMGAAIIIAIQSVHNIVTPHEVPAPFTLFVLILVIIVKEGMFRFVNQTGDEIKSTAVKADAWHHRSDALTSLTAAIGITIALVGGPEYASADDWAALVASGFIMYNGYHIFAPAFREIMDTAPSGEIVEDVRRIALGVDRVEGTEKCLVRKMGFEYFVDLHVLVDGNLSVREGHDIAHAVKDAIRAKRPRVYDVIVHIEPSTYS
jgi:cation diffusion facilitator family transporter